MGAAKARTFSYVKSPPNRRTGMAGAESRLPPQNVEAEQSVLGGILIDNQAFHRVIDIISPEDFYRPANGKIFSAMCDLASKGEPIDVVTLSSKMKELEIYEEVGGAAYLAELLERVPTAVHCEYHAKLVTDQAVKRRLVSTCNEISARGLEPGETTDELLDYAEKSIFGLTSSKRVRSLVPVRDIVRSAFIELEHRFENQGNLTGIPSGYVDLDKMTSGFQRSDLIVVACRPSVGKTSFSLGVTRHAAVLGKYPVVFFSLEMSKEQIVTRLLAAEAKVDATRIRNGNLTENDWSKLTRAAGMLSEAQIYIDDTPALSVLEMRGKARQSKAFESRVWGVGTHRSGLSSNYGDEQVRSKPRKCDFRNLAFPKGLGQGIERSSHVPFSGESQYRFKTGQASDDGRPSRVGSH
jgi:replicative DNA helicase